MKSDAFADTSYFLALMNPRDEAHQRAVELLNVISRFTTTQWVLAELGNSLSRTAARPRFLKLLELLAQHPGATVIPATAEMFERAVAFFQARPDKDWSFTDCTSILAIMDHELTVVLSGDHHVEQAGFELLL